jgi:hypothetical protein
MSRRPAAALASLLLGVTLLTGCGESEADRVANRAERAANEVADRVREEAEKLPDVDWGKQGEKLKRRVDRLADEADCSRLRKLARQEADDTQVTRYIKAQRRRAC